ncbi:MAG: 30S ribosomal protein S16 [Elusimicrobia bacterium CG08_land_8_20_14_0_20_51_18]|nr:MAG: 30S ribosomal protein S16 [Elusimicrobia bacterium CG08_land_8_20_14_0_20_51_18]
MAVVVRLQRGGKRVQPHYRIVAIEKSSGPKGPPLEVLGHYNPKADKPKDKVQVKLERVDHWIKNGAKPSETVRSLINKAKAA